MKGARLSGIGLTKVQEFLRAEMGIKLAADKNLRSTDTKCRKGIESVYESRKIENRKEHVAAVSASGEAKLEWSSDGVTHSTSCGDVSWDGAGATRLFRHNHKGRQAAAVVNSKATKKPLALAVSQVSV